MNRSKAREQAFFVLFQKAFYINTALAELIERSKRSNYISNDGFTNELCEAAFEHLKEIDELLTERTENWQFNRLSKVAISVLRLAVSEIRYIDDIPLKVSINEAIELTKKFSGEEEAGFVNGVLAKIAKDLKKI